MGKHIKPFTPGIIDLNEDSYIDFDKGNNEKSKEEVSVNAEMVNKLKDTHKTIAVKGIESQLKIALEDYWKNKKQTENIILEAKERLDENYKKMMQEFEKSIQKLDLLGVDIKNDEIELDELTIVLRTEEKMYELTDEDKSKLYDIFVSLNKAHADACKDLAKSMNAISEVINYTEFGVFYKKAEGVKRHKEAYFRSEITTPVKESLELNESIVSKVYDFFKTVGEKIKGFIFNVESSLEEFDVLMIEAKKIIG